MVPSDSLFCCVSPFHNPTSKIFLCITHTDAVSHTPNTSLLYIMLIIFFFNIRNIYFLNTSLFHILLTRQFFILFLFMFF